MVAKQVNLPQWCIAAGFVRSAVWDYFHAYDAHTAFDDVDLIYFNSQARSESQDRRVENRLNEKLAVNWSVKNQARMHLRNSDQAYASTIDAMSYWPEIETAVGITWQDGEFKLISPFPLEQVLSCSVSLNLKRAKVLDFKHRVKSKQWLQKWPKLKLNTG